MTEAIDKVTSASPQLDSPHLVPQPTPNIRDGVFLSETAQANLLAQEGLSVSEIAEQLGVSTSTVISELAFTVPVSQPAVSKT